MRKSWHAKGMALQTGPAPRIANHRVSGILQTPGTQKAPPDRSRGAFFKLQLKNFASFSSEKEDSCFPLKYRPLPASGGQQFLDVDADGGARPVVGANDDGCAHAPALNAQSPRGKAGRAKAWAKDCRKGPARGPPLPFGRPVRAGWPLRCAQPESLRRRQSGTGKPIKKPRAMRERKRFWRFFV